MWLGRKEIGVSTVSLGKAVSWLFGGSVKAAQKGLHKTLFKGARMDDSRSQKGKSHNGQWAH